MVVLNVSLQEFLWLFIFLLLHLLDIINILSCYSAWEGLPYGSTDGAKWPEEQLGGSFVSPTLVHGPALVHHLSCLYLEFLFILDFCGFLIEHDHIIFS